MTDLGILGPRTLRDLSRRLRAASNGKTVRTALAKSFRSLSAPVVADVRREVMAINVRGVRGHGSQRREGTFRAHRPRARTPRGGFGLRATIARGAKSSVRLSGTRVGLRIFIDTSHMPRSQRNLPSHLDNPKGWRHPTFGRRGKGDWAQQFGEPYFRRTMQRHTPNVRRAAVAAIHDALKELQQ